MKVLIADDEPAVREGLKSIIDWHKLGFSVCGEAANGAECLEKMLTHAPDLVLLDIRMPGRLHGLDVAEQAKEQGFQGKIIIISGYSDFKYAQSAIRFGVHSYLLKPIDEEELESAVRGVSSAIEQQRRNAVQTHRYIDKAREAIIADILEGKTPYKRELLSGCEGETDGFQAEAFCVAACEGGRRNEENPLHRLLMLPLSEKQRVETLSLYDRGICVIKGRHTIELVLRQVRELNHNCCTNEAPPYFAALGKTVSTPQDLPASYRQAMEMLDRRFFYPRNICFATEPDIAPERMIQESVRHIDIGQYVERLLSFIDACNSDKVAEYVKEMSLRLRRLNVQPEDVKSLLATFIVQMKHGVLAGHRQLRTSFESDTALIATVHSAARLYEIEEYVTMKAERIIAAIGNTSREHVIDNIVSYINKNYHKNLKLESLAELFGYNKAYLGKVLKNNLGEYFNSYLDRVRITNAKELLRQDRYKVYEISERIGYNNIDYFYKKFKRYVGETPCEYRKRFGITAEADERPTVTPKG